MKNTKKKKKMNPPLYLPHEVIIEILLRLPVKSLISFKCVCKLWFSLISDPHFANSHFQLASATQTQTRRIVYLVNHEPRSIDFEDSLDIVNNASVLRNLTFVRQEHFSDLVIKGSCRGFILLHCGSHIALWNPSTGFHKQIPLCSYSFGAHPDDLCGLGYDKLRDEYLVVLMCCYPRLGDVSSHLEFFSLTDNKWKEIEGTHFPYRNGSDKPIVGLFYNTAIHWSVVRHDLWMQVIVAFDLIERRLSNIPFPDDFDRMYVSHDCGLWVFGEFLSLWVIDYLKNNGTVEIWVMNEYTVQSSWTKTLVLPIHFIPSEFFFPLCSTKSGEIIGTDDACGLVRYDDKGQWLEYLFDSDERGGYEMAVYTESLLSLPEPGDGEQA
ncbi:F-box/kelch-repeat protein At3g06240-like [Trifolium pratense]|uniref:F-box/kelch-repeat protein At3g06240-like n=1 Tax=Trifolium pratense TaxID=57577 RepID=UPI001E693E45|nr:F-box/kelch-repeat protein At3g06240-like [Trifolium pratense]